MTSNFILCLGQYEVELAVLRSIANDAIMDVAHSAVESACLERRNVRVSERHFCEFFFTYYQ